MDQKEPKELWLSAAECAQRTGLTVRALRLYENRGLIVPRRTGSNWRLYGPREQERINEIVTLKSFGLSLAHIGKLLTGRETDIDSILELQRNSFLNIQASAGRGLALIEAAKNRSAQGGPAINDLMQIAKEISMMQMTADAVAWKRYEQSRPRTQTTLSARELLDYVGYFEMSDGVVTEITEVNGSLFIAMNGLSKLEIYPEASDRFFYNVLAAQCTFDRDGQGLVYRVVLHQDGLERTGQRITADIAQKHLALLRDRISNKRPFQKSSDILSALIVEAQTGLVDWTKKTEDFKLATEKWVPGVKSWLSDFGKETGHEFVAVNASGWDVYHVSFEKGVLEWSFILDKSGKISGEYIRDLPG